MKPVVAIYSTFLQRAYDQLIHDVAPAKPAVVFALDRAGWWADGATHGCVRHSFVRCIPNMSMACPADERECRQLLSTALNKTTRLPCVTRAAKGQVWPLGFARALPFGQGRSAVNAWQRMTSPRRAWPSFALAPCCTRTGGGIVERHRCPTCAGPKPLDVDLLLGRFATTMPGDRGRAPSWAVRAAPSRKP